MLSRRSSPASLFPARRGVVSIVALAALFALACAPDPSGDDSPVASDGTGSVSVFLTDAPSDEFVSVHVTVSEIELIGGDGPVTLFEGEETFDLLQLRNVSELFALADDVPVGTYRGLRLQIDALEVVVELEDGTIETHEPEIPADGRWLLVTDEPLEVTEDQTLAVEVDVDVAKSIRATHIGARLRYVFRPVVFLKILHNHFDGRLVRLHGVVREIDESSGSFDLCHMRRPLPWIGMLARRAADALEARGFDLPERPTIFRCVNVSLLDRGSIFGTEGAPVGFAGLEEGGRATVIGHVAPSRAGIDLLAEIALLGPRGTYTRIAGSFVSELGDDDRIDLELRPGQGFAPGSVLAVQLFEQSRLFSRGGMEIERDELEPGLRAAATGVIVLSDGDEDLINTPILIVELDEDEDPHMVSGSIARIDPETGEITLETEDGQLCVRTFPRTRFFSVDLDLGKSMVIGLEDLAIGDDIDVFGRPTTDDCFGAGVVIAFTGGDAG